ncbi:MAG: class I SAM-dependent methyltransferase [Candidatus Nealsonbacteria bacterium]|nr:class I SAM-dependent methyltransferase [Candidatus Nealsonbacteria bacterium]
MKTYLYRLWRKILRLLIAIRGDRYGLMRWDVLIKIIQDNHYTKIAEIGVDKGETTKHILKNCKLDSYYLIDPIFSDSARKIIRKPAVFLQMKSEEAVKQFLDESLDLVFIDADHSYEEVKKDIEFWLPKIRKGGVLTGHDYDYPRHPDVKKAVDEVLGRVDTVIIEYKRGTNRHNNLFYYKKS